MAYVTLSRSKLHANYERLSAMLESANIEWGAVTKMFCGEISFIDEVLKLGVPEAHDSRIHNLRTIKEHNPDVQTVYIKPPAIVYVEDVVRWADVSFNTEMATLQAIDEEARRQGTTHLAIIMVEMGDLREGVPPHRLLDFYRETRRLANVDVVGIGTNLNCLNGTYPSESTLTELVELKAMLERETGDSIRWVSAGTTVTLPLIERGELPEGVNHFRLGEALYFGADLFENTTFDGMHDDVLELHAHVIEVREKPMAPSGPVGANPFGRSNSELMFDDPERHAYRIIVDIGYLDANPDYLILEDPDMSILDASSDMLVIDAGHNPRGLTVGDDISFKLKYMGALHLMSSNYVDKKVVA